MLGVPFAPLVSTSETTDVATVQRGLFSKHFISRTEQNMYSSDESIETEIISVYARRHDLYMFSELDLEGKDYLDVFAK